MERLDKAIELHHKGFNCAQAVVMAYCDMFDMDEKTAMRAAEGFGGGMGGFNSTCGALSGCVMLAGLKDSDGDTENGPKTKMTTYADSKAMDADFREFCGAGNCNEIKSGKKISCDGCIAHACEMAEKYLLGAK